MSTPDMVDMRDMVVFFTPLEASVLPREMTQIHRHTLACYTHKSETCQFGASFMMIVVLFPQTQAPED